MRRRIRSKVSLAVMLAVLGESSIFHMPTACGYGIFQEMQSMSQI